jgi:hypothetical protein
MLAGGPGSQETLLPLLGLYPTDEDDELSPIRGADAAVYHAKEQSRNNFQLFSEALSVAALQRLFLDKVDLSLRNREITSEAEVNALVEEIRC